MAKIGLVVLVCCKEGAERSNEALSLLVDLCRTFTSGYNLWGSDHNNKSFFSEQFNFL